MGGAAFGHGLDGVLENIEQHLLDFPGTAEHRVGVGRFRRGIPADLGRFPVPGAGEIVVLVEQGQGLLHEPGQGMGAEGGLVLAAEGEHILDDVADAPALFPGVCDDVEDVPSGHVFGDLLQGDAQFLGRLVVHGQGGREPVVDDLEVLEQAGQGIVDFVGHARGQAPQGHHLFRLDEHFLHADLLGDVVDADDGPHVRAVRAEGIEGDPGGERGLFQGEGHLVPGAAFPVLQGPGQILQGVPQMGEQLGQPAARGLVRGNAGEGLGVDVPMGENAVGGQPQEHGGHGVDDPGNIGLGPLFLGDVPQGDQPSQGGRVRGGQGPDAHVPLPVFQGELSPAGALVMALVDVVQGGAGLGQGGDACDGGRLGDHVSAEGLVGGQDPVAGIQDDHGIGHAVHEGLAGQGHDVEKANPGEVPGEHEAGDHEAEGGKIQAVETAHGKDVDGVSQPGQGDTRQEMAQLAPAFGAAGAIVPDQQQGSLENEQIGDHHVGPEENPPVKDQGADGAAVVDVDSGPHELMGVVGENQQDHGGGEEADAQAAGPGQVGVPAGDRGDEAVEQDPQPAGAQVFQPGPPEFQFQGGAEEFHAVAHPPDGHGGKDEHELAGGALLAVGGQVDGHDQTDQAGGQGEGAVCQGPVHRCPVQRGWFRIMKNQKSTPSHRGIKCLFYFGLPGLISPQGWA